MTQAKDKKAGKTGRGAAGEVSFAARKLIFERFFDPSVLVQESHGKNPAKSIPETHELLLSSPLCV